MLMPISAEALGGGGASSVTTPAAPTTPVANSGTVSAPPTTANQSGAATANSVGTTGALSKIGDFLGGVTIGTPLKIIDGVLELLVLPYAGFIFWLTGQMLDLTIEYSLNISQTVTQASSAIILGWTIVRDIFNMMSYFY